MAWTYLFIAGLSEIVWALSMKQSQGFSKFWPSVFTVLFMGVSFYFLTLSTKTLPISIAYTVWVGVGAIGALLGGMFWLKESLSLLQIFFACLIITGVVGIKLVHISK